MADDDEAEAEAGGDGEGSEDAPKGRAGGKKKLIIIGAAALLLLGGGGGAAFFLMGGDSEDSGMASADSADDAPADEPGDETDLLAGPNRPGYVGLPNLLVNLSSDSSRQVYLRIEATLELASNSDVRDARDRSDAIVDGFQTFLREMRPRDISGSGGLIRLKEELLVRANDAIGRDVVRNVYLTEFLIQ